MKKFYYFSLLFGLVFGSLTFVACGGDDDDPAPKQENNNSTTPSGNQENNNPTTPTGNDLVGTWTVKVGYQQERESQYIFTQDQLTIIDYGQERFKGAYKLNGDILTYVTVGEVYNDSTETWENKEYTVTLKVNLVKNNTILTVKEQEEYNGNKEYRLIALAVKEGVNFTTEASEIQGTWIAYEEGNYPVFKMTVNDYKFDFIILPWSSRLTGTLSYSAGVMKLNVEASYHSKGNVNPETLEATWIQESETDGRDIEEGFFVAVGSEAYGAFVGRPMTFVKK